MATRVEKILANARITLSDQSKERWSDDDLLRILDEGHKDICRHTQLINDRVDIFLEVGEPYFDLPEDLWLISRITYDDVVIPMVSHTDLDEYPLTRRFADFDYSSNRWETEEGEPEAFLYDRRNLLKGRIYPIPTDAIFENPYTFQAGARNEYEIDGNNIYGVVVDSVDDLVSPTDGVASSWDDFDFSSGLGVVTRAISVTDDLVFDFVGEETLGVVVNIDNYTLTSVYGIVTDLYDPQFQSELFSSPYGVITQITENNKPLRVWYIKYPSDLETVFDDLETPYMFDTALKYYVVGHAFLNDLDAGWQQKGTQQLELYNRELQIAGKTQVRDGTRAGQFETNYRRAF